MKRTSRRPLVARGGTAVVKPGEALASGILLGVAVDACCSGVLANWLAAALADGAILFYVFVYTLGLKRRTASNIVIGGAAGCFPVLVGWAAVTGKVSVWAGVLFAVIFFWTPPHFWALAMKFKDDYAAANVPMLPVVAAPAVVARKIVALLLGHGRGHAGARAVRGLDLRLLRAGRSAGGSWPRRTSCAAASPRIRLGTGPPPRCGYSISRSCI